ncbi:MAG: hypothetical protein AB7F96_14055 [Beijerinckiaceae bacterium]
MAASGDATNNMKHLALIHEGLAARQAGQGSARSPGIIAAVIVPATCRNCRKKVVQPSLSLAARRHDGPDLADIPYPDRMKCEAVRRYEGAIIGVVLIALGMFLLAGEY